MKPITFCVAVLVALTAAGTASALEVRVTSDPGVQNDPAVFRDTVVYADSRNGNWDIYTFDLNAMSERRLTFNAADQAKPKVSGSTVVYEDNRNGNWDIYAVDLVTGVERRLSFDPGNDRSPDINGSLVTWTSYGKASGTVYDLLGNTQIAVPDHWYMSGVFGDSVESILMYDLDVGYYRPCLLNVETGAQVFGDAGDWRSIDSSREYIAGQGMGGSQFEVLAASTGEMLAFGTSPGAGDFSLGAPALSGGTLCGVYSGSTSTDVWALDIDSSSWTNVTGGRAIDPSSPAISREWIVWVDSRNGQADIYAASLDRALPRVEVSGETDFGPASVGSTLEGAVTVANTGDAPLQLDDVQITQSGSAFAAVVPATTIVPPGGSVVVPIAFTADGLGAQSAVLRIYTDDVDLPVIRLSLAGVGVTTIAADAEALREHVSLKVSAGALAGAGGGNSAAGKMIAFENMLTTATQLIHAGRYPEALDQLQSAYLKCDGVSSPRDSVAGDACAEVARMIQALIVRLEAATQ